MTDLPPELEDDDSLDDLDQLDVIVDENGDPVPTVDLEDLQE